MTTKAKCGKKVKPKKAQLGGLLSGLLGGGSKKCGGVVKKKKK